MPGFLSAITKTVFVFTKQYFERFAVDRSRWSAASLPANQSPSARPANARAPAQKNAQGAPSVAKLPRCTTKRFQPGLSPTPQDGFANAAVSKCGSGRGCDHPDGKASKRTRFSAGGERGRSQIVRGVCVRVSSGHVRGARSGFWGFSVRSGLEFFRRAVGRRIYRCVPKKRDATARLYAVSRCRFFCAPMRSWPPRQSSGAGGRPADGHQRQSKYRSDVGRHQRNHHRHQFFPRDCGQVWQQRGRLFHRQQRNSDHRDLAGWDRHR